MSKTKIAPASAAAEFSSEPPAPSEIIVTPPAPPPASDLASEVEPQSVTPWLTTAPSEGFGPSGHILNLTDDQAAEAPEGLLIAPTPEQLAQRL